MEGENMSCQMCKYFDEHPFIRDGDYRDFCILTEEATHPNNSCEQFTED